MLVSNSLRLIPFTLFLLCLLIVGGCQQTIKLSSTARVKVLVSINGEPLKEAKVVFIPIEFRDPSGEIVPLAQGTTDDQGVCELVYPDKSNDVVMGEYDVVITRSDQNHPGRFLQGRHAAIQSQIGQYAVGMFENPISDLDPTLNYYSTIRVELVSNRGKCEVKIELQSAAR